MEDAGGYTKQRVNNQWNLTSALQVQHKTKTKPLKHTTGLTSCLTEINASVGQQKDLQLHVQFTVTFQ